MDEIRAMPAPDRLRYRRFYNRFPFGLAWQVRMAWLAGAIGRQVYSKHPTSETDAIKAYCGTAKRRRKRRPILERPGTVARLAVAMGATGAPK